MGSVYVLIKNISATTCTGQIHRGLNELSMNRTYQAQWLKILAHPRVFYFNVCKKMVNYCLALAD